MRGDLIFCTTTGDLTGRVVQWAERRLGATPPAAEVVHVGIECGSSDEGRVVTALEAVWPRVRRGQYDLLGDTHVKRVPWGARYTQPRRDRALAWVEGQVTARDGYGWSDALTNAAHILGVPLSIFQQHGFDCSHLAFVYMTLAGEDWTAANYPGAADWAAAPQQVNPANLFDYTQYVLGKGLVTAS